MNKKILLGLAIGAVIIAGAVYAWTVAAKKALPIEPQVSVATSTSESEPEAVSVNQERTETGYITAISDNSITIDYVDILYGEPALKAMIADGKCNEGDTMEVCFPSVPLYDRNVNPKLRTFTLSPSVEAFTYFEEPLTVEGLKEYGWSRVDAYGRYGMLFTFTFNAAGEVTKIEGVFRP